jgi:lysophospholipase L1-like esterase
MLARKTKLILFLGLAACKGKPDYSQCYVPFPTPTTGARLIAVGDSQTHGARSCLVSNGESYMYSWADKVANDKDLELVNQSVGGSMLTDAVESGVALSFTYQSTDTVVMLIGYNDMANFGLDPTHLDLFKTTLTNVLQTVSPQVHQILVGEAMYPLDYKGNASPQAVVLYRQAIENVVNGLALPNVTATVVDGSFAGQSWAYQGDDGIHITTAAQTIVAQVFENLLN